MVLLDTAWCQKHDTLLADQNFVCLHTVACFPNPDSAAVYGLLRHLSSMNVHASKSSMHAVVATIIII